MPARQGRGNWDDFPHRRGNVLKESRLEQLGREFFEQDNPGRSWEDASTRERVDYRDQARQQLGKVDG